MRMLEKDAKFGKIIQVNSGIARFLHPDYFVIQTFGKPLNNTVLCTERLKVKSLLDREIDKDVMLFSISTFDADEEFVSWLRLFTCTGRNIYVFSFNQKKMWYCDSVIS
ncbi:hypothetical protein GINT2_002347 [Glugoides intestinalis]